jgi:uncharacterized membrane protein YkvA (DUF1232 family)
MSLDFDHAAFFRKCRRFLGVLPFAEELLALYFCMIDPDTPLWVKGSIAATLAYFVLPFDAVPDFIPVAGMADDGTAVGSTVSLVASHIRPEHYAKAREWFKS